MKRILGLVLGALILAACKRDKVEVIGPNLAIASPNFSLENDVFSAELASVDFTLDTNWFNASFNERVSWELVLRGEQSSAVKRFKGVSSSLSRANTNWTGTQSDLYFFRIGENVIAELSVFGSNKKWYDTIVVVKEKNKWLGSDLLIWWDMNTTGVAQNGWPYVYWFDFYDTNERLADFMVSSQAADPIQGFYRSIEGKDGLGPSDYFVGSASHSPMSTPTGFNTGMDNVWFNFYVRRRTTTTNAGFAIISIASGDTATLFGETGIIETSGWQLVSFRLSDLTTTTGDPAFHPESIAQIRFNTYIATKPGEDQTGFDVDFITFTQGGPFNPEKY